MLENEPLHIDISLFKDVRKVLLAVSGGADSVTMACVLAKLKKQGRLSSEFVMGHVNHGLRGADSKGDEIFVKELGCQLEIPVAAVSISVSEYAKEQKLSIETAGRVLRLKTLVVMAVEHDCDCIATAHHKDDLAETMIHRLIRGTGFRGLCGIWPVSHVYGAEFIRPMLTVRRAEIIQHCKDNSIQYREDASNQNTIFTRNRIRHHLLPFLHNESNGTVERLSELSFKCRRFLQRTEKHARSILAKGRMDRARNEFSLKQQLLWDCPPWVVYEVWREVLVELAVGLRDYTQQHFDAINEMVKQEKIKADFPGHIEILVNKGIVIVQKKNEPTVLPQDLVTLEIGKSVEFGPWRVSCQLLHREDVDLEQSFKTKDAFVEWFDTDTICGSIKIRVRQDGDRFRPFGGKSEKKVARFLQDGQLNTGIKENSFIIADTEQILWVAPVRMSEHAKVTNKTTQILEIQVVHHEVLD